ncbi:hypothetical protein RND81_05G231000 [Saponaria officinalis]|uniref:BED-type domain-containing protein n=1 Tax=Saponaria officinalis TaxID=3572 RepID=A0AAW1KW54_SAPOF
MEPQPSNTQDIDPSVPLQPESTNVWMTADNMLKVINRRGSSVVWPHFFLSTNKLRAKCRYCGVIYNFELKNGTGRLSRHINSCRHRPESDQRHRPET